MSVPFTFAPLSVENLPNEVRRELKPVVYGGNTPLNGRVFEVPSWGKWSIPHRLEWLRLYTEDRARDPQINTFVGHVLQKAKVKIRAYPEQWNALLKWVQENVYYVNEPNERLQSPQFTLEEALAKKGGGDCDDMAILLASLGHAINLPWTWVIAGRGSDGQRVRWIAPWRGKTFEATFIYAKGNRERVKIGGPLPRRVSWTHIYLAVGWPAFTPDTWAFAEPTLKVPLGWDVHSLLEQDSILPELKKRKPSDILAGAFAAEVEAEAPTSRVAATIKALPWTQILTATIPPLAVLLAGRALDKGRR